MEIGGTRGKTLTATAKDILHGFNRALETFQKVEYDVLDASEASFESDYDEFQRVTCQLERRLSSVISRVTYITLLFFDQSSYRPLMIARR